MSALRTLVFGGHVDACAFLIAPDTIGQLAARARVVAWWRPGARLDRIGALWLLRFDGTVRIDTRSAPGLALVRDGALLTATPLSPAERARLAGAFVVIPRDGVAVGHAAPTAADVIDPSVWLDLSGWSVAEVDGLGAAAPPVLTVVPVKAQVSELLGAGVSLATQRAEVAREVHARLEPRANALPSVWSRMLGWFGPKAVAAAGSARQGWFERLRQWVERRAMASVIGKHNERYLNDVVDMFEQGRVLDALRHAIPLAGEAGRDRGEPAGRLGPRSSLSISPRAIASRSTVLANDFYDLLRQKYEVALNRLKAAGQHDEVAFILAELLNRPQEAALHLEQHGRFEAAARLAETRQLRPDLVIRLWCRAGNLERAVALARRHRVFAPVVLELEKLHDPRAREMRARWADDLFRGGELVAAVETAWPLGEHERLQQWIDIGMAAEGLEAAQLLIAQLALRPERFAAMAALVQRWSRDGSSTMRAALAEQLVKNRWSEVKRTMLAALARPLARALVRDAAAHTNENVLRRLLDATPLDLDDIANDLSLPTRYPTPAVQLATARPARAQSRAAASGTLPIHDAAWLDHGYALLALGELGTRLVRGDGSVVHHFDAPAYKLSLADGGGSAIAIVRRGDLTQLTQLDLSARTARSLGMLALVDVARTFDGTRLWAIESDALLVLDVHAAEPSILWRVGGLAHVDWIARDATHVAFTTSGPDGREAWSYDTHTLRIAQRRLLAIGEGPKIAALHASGRCALSQDMALWTTRLQEDWKLVPHAMVTAFPLPTLVRGDVEWVGGWLVARRDVQHVVLIDEKLMEQRLVVEVDASTGVRLGTTTLTLYDAMGRARVLSLASGEIIAEIRILL